jgi:hypothetical protein
VSLLVSARSGPTPQAPITVAATASNTTVILDIVVLDDLQSAMIGTFLSLALLAGRALTPSVAPASPEVSLGR